jgi:hypothetical protein
MEMKTSHNGRINGSIKKKFLGALMEINGN